MLELSDLFSWLSNGPPKIFGQSYKFSLQDVYGITDLSFSAVPALLSLLYNPLFTFFLSLSLSLFLSPCLLFLSPSIRSHIVVQCPYNVHRNKEQSVGICYVVKLIWQVNSKFWYRDIDITTLVLASAVTTPGSTVCIKRKCILVIKAVSCILFVVDCNHFLSQS